MANYEILKAAIRAVVKENANNEITGDLLQQALISIINSLGDGFQFIGVAEPTTNPGTPDQNVFYLASNPGIYQNFNNIHVYFEIAVLCYNGSWSKKTIIQESGIVNFALNGSEKPNINTLAGTLDLGSDPNIIIGSKNFNREDFENVSDYRAIALQGTDSSRRKLVFNVETVKFRAINFDAALSQSEILVGSLCTRYSESGVYIPGSFKWASLPFEYTIDGRGIGDGDNFALTGAEKPNINTLTGILDLGSDPNIIIGSKNFNREDFESVSDYRAISLQGTDSSRRKLVFNFETIKFRSINYDMELSQSEILVGSFCTSYSASGVYIPGSFKWASLPFEYTIDGRDIGEGDNFTLTGAEKPNINTLAGILDLGSDPTILVGGKNFTRDDFESVNDYRAIALQGGESSRRKLVFNFETVKFRSIDYYMALSQYEILVGSFCTSYSESGVYIPGSFKWASLPFEYTIDGRDIWDSVLNKSEYFGEVLPVRKMFKTEKLFDLAECGIATYPVDTQGMDVYDDKYLIQGNDAQNQKSIYVIDIQQKSILGNFLFTENGAWHLNNINCAAKENTNDKFPLIYVSECNGTHRCAVVKINNDASGYQIKQILTFNTTQHFGAGVNPFDWFVDVANNLLYAYGQPLSTRGPIEIVKFALPALASQTTLNDSDVIDSFIVQGIGVYQGSKLINGKLVCPVGFGDSEWPAYIKVIDLEKKSIVSSVPWSGEPEAVSMYKDGLLVVNNSSTPTYILLTI